MLVSIAKTIVRETFELLFICLPVIFQRMTKFEKFWRQIEIFTHSTWDIIGIDHVKIK